MRQVGKTFAMTALALTAGLPAYAGGKFAAPAGCEIYVTVQMRGCQVSNHYRCQGDAPGDQWSVFLDGDGPFYMSKIDAETRWIESFDLTNGEHDKLISETDPASFTNLITTGRDDYDFRTESSAGEIRRYTGYDTLTGETVTIDGVRLERTKFSLTAKNDKDELLWQRTGQQYIHRDWRIFFADLETFENSFGDREDLVDTPVNFSVPGDKGFRAAEPDYDCDMMMTDLPFKAEGPKS